MLQNIRDNSRGIISYILIGILVLFFAISGIEALFSWNAEDYAAKVNGEKISKMALERAIQNQKDQIISRYGNQVPAEFVSDEYLRKPALENLIRREVLVQQARDAGLTASQSDLMQMVTSQEGFKDDQGNFDNQKYVQLLANAGFTHSSYLKLLTEDQIINQLQTGIGASAFTLPYEVDNLVSLSFQSRDVQYFQIPINQVRDSVTVTDEEIDTEYKSNPDKYTAEEQVAVDYIELRSSDLMKGINITEEEIRKQYEQNISTFVAKPERQAAHLLIEGDKPDLIKEVEGKIAAGEDFAGLVKKYSDDLGSKEQGGDLGFSTGDVFPAEFESALANLKVGEVSGPVKTDAGTHFIKLLSERGEKAPSFEDQKALIEDQLKRAQAENLFVEKLKKLKEDTFNAEKLADVAPGLGLDVKNTGLISRSSGKGISSEAKFVEAAFSNDVVVEGNASEPIELDPSHVVVVKKTEHQPSHLKSLSEVKDQILSNLKESKARLLLAEKSQDFIKQIQAGSAIVEVAKNAGYELKESKTATRSSKDLDAEVLRQAFTMPKPTANLASVSGLTMSNGDYAVIAVQSVTPADKSTLPQEQQTAITTQLSYMNGQQSIESFQKALEDRAEIERN